MRERLWTFDTVLIDLEDRDVTVRLVHARSSASISVAFRMAEAAIETSVHDLRRRAEFIARDRILELASFLDTP